MNSPPKAYHTAKPFIEYDVSQWPFVYCLVNPIDPSADIFQAHLDCFKELLERDEEFCILYNLTNACMISTSLFPAQIAFTEVMESKIRANLNSSSLVTENICIQQLIELLFKIKPPMKPNHVTGSLHDASTWLVAQMKHG